MFMRKGYLQNLRDPRGLAAGHGGGGQGSAHSGYARRHDGNPHRQQWSSVQVVPHPGRQDAEDEELQYVLELSMVEK
jgi:hypothetical protein